MQVRLTNVRIAFPSLAKPEAFGDGEPAYQAKFIIVPKSEQAKALKAAIASVASEAWKDKAAAVLKLLTEDKKVCYVEAPYRNKKSGETYVGFEDAFYLSARNAKQRPTIIAKTGTIVDDVAEIDRLIYSGCYVHATVDVWAQDNKWGRRVNATLTGVMFAKDGDAFGGTPVASASDFADLAVAEESLI